MKTHTLGIIVAASLIAATTSIAAQSDDGRPMQRKHERHAQMLERFDKDGDGKLSDAERAAAKEAMLAENPGAAGRHAKNIKKFDTDGDGQLSETERAAARDQMKRRGEKLREGVVGKFDKDGDGVLSEEERGEARAMAQARGGERRERMLRHFDKDGDGKLSDAERAEARKAVEEFLDSRSSI